MPRIAAHEPIPADKDEVAEHLQAIAYHPDARGRIVRPADRHFHGAQAMPLGEKQDLGIESESFDALLLKNDLRWLTHECLESALGVMKRQSREQVLRAR